MRMTSHDIIRKPVITEKSMAAMAENKLELWEKLREWAYMLERELTKRKLS